METLLTYATIGLIGSIVLLVITVLSATTYSESTIKLVAICLLSIVVYFGYIVFYYVRLWFFPQAFL